MIVIESFDNYSSNIPTDLDWDFSSPATTYGTSPLHVTQGVASYVWVGASSAFTRLTTSTPIDLTGVNSVDIDIYVTNIDASDYAVFTAGNGMKGGTITDLTSAGATGAFTLNLDVSALSPKNSVNLFLDIVSAGTLGYTVNWDNLRTDGTAPARTDYGFFIFM